MKKKKTLMFIVIALVNLAVILGLYIFLTYYADDYRWR
jgi:hypothetical protein